MRQKIKLNYWRTLMALTFVMAALQLHAQQPSGTHVSSYNFSQNSITYPFITGGTAIQISTTGTNPSGGSQSGFLVPFNFRYNGRLYTGTDAIWISYNGYITIRAGTASPTVITTLPLSSTNTAFNYPDGGMISAFGGTLVGNGTAVTGNTGTSTSFLRVGTVGTTPNRKFYIQWENMRRAAATADSWNFNIVINEDGGTQSNQIEFNYGSMTFGSTAASNRQVGLRGFVSLSDVQLRCSASGLGGWSSSFLGAAQTGNNTTATNTMLLNNTTLGTTYPASGLQYIYTPCAVSTPYASLPYSMDFESAWSNYSCGSGAASFSPGSNWKAASLIGDASWRRQDAGASAGWRFLPGGTVAPSGSTGCANFHSYGAVAGMQGSLDLFVDLSGGTKDLSFTTINATGTDILEVFLSTDGGQTFGSAIGSYGVNASWSTKNITISTGTATSVIRFRATSDFGDDDIGLDNITITNSASPPNCAVLVSPANGSSGLCPVIRWADGGGAASYDVYFGTAPNPPFVANTTNTYYVPVGGYTNGQTYYWKIIPQNVNGSATGCTEWSYTAGSLSSCYCIPTSTNGGTGGDGITGISFANLNQTGNTPIGPPGYGDATGITINVNQGSIYQAIFNQQDPSDAVKVWIDFNDNGSFEDAGEMVLQTGTGTTVLGSIAIPLTAPIGTHRLRIRNTYNTSNPVASMTSCSAVAYGETRDFSLAIAAAITDASVTNVYSLGSLPKGYGDPHVVRARVYNGGAFTLTSLNVTMNITGANTFNDVQTVASLAPGASTIVSFAGFNPSVTGNNTITVSVPSDGDNSNNSSSWDQEVTSNIYSYKNPLQTNFGGVGFNSATGDFVGKFAASNNFGNSDTINEVQVEFTTTGNNYQIGIWAADGVGGIPGTLLYTSPTYTTATGGPQIKAIPNVVVSGDFYVGARQVGTTNIGFAYQAEIPVRNQSFYFTSPSGTSSWQDFSQPANPSANPFRFSIQVRMEVPQIPLCPVLLSPADASTACQNGTTLSWNTGGGGTTNYDVYLSTNQTDVTNELPAALVTNTTATSYTTGALVAGQTYYWKIVGKNAYGQSAGCTVRSFTTNLYSCYCAANSANGSFEHIGNVSYGTFSNTSGSSTYTPYFNLGSIGTMARGITNNISVTVNNVYSTDKIYVYIDLNQNGSFADANELVGTYNFTTGTGAAPQTVVVPLSVDVSALLGNTGMRIKMGDSDILSTVPVDNTPCQTGFSFGEVEDYIVNIACGVATASSNLPVCQGQSLNLTSSFNGAGSVVSYAWTGPNGYANSSQNPTISNVSVSDDGAYTVTITATGGCVVSATVNVVTTPSPNAVASSNGDICIGNDISLSSDNVAPGQGTGNTYSWTGPNFFSSTAQNPTISNPGVNASGTYDVVVTNQYGCTATASASSDVHPNPSLSILSQQNVGCVGGSDGVLNIGATNGTAPYDFTTDFVIYNQTGVMTNLPTGTTTVYVSDFYGCQAQITGTLTALHSAPPAQSVVVPMTGFPAYACPGTVASLSIPTVANATQYIWDGPPGTYFNGNPLNVSPFTTTTPNVQITFGTPSTSLYSIGVQAANGCGASLRKIQKARYSVSTPASVSGNTTACASSSGGYSTAPVDAATQYLWTITGDATVTGTGTNVTVNFGPAWNGGTLCVAAQTTCYTSPTKCITIGTSAAALGAISGTFTACPNSSLTFSVPASSGAASYSWTLPAGATGSSTTNSINVNFGPTFSAGGNICVSVTSICGITSAPKCKTVAPGTPSVPASITGITNGVCGQNVAYSTPSVSGTTYNWSAPGTITGNGNSAVSVQYGTLTTGQVCVTASNACGSSAARCVAVKGSPNSPSAITATPSSWCANTSGVEFNANVSGITGSYTLSWTYPSAPVATYSLGGGNSTQLVLDWGTGNGTIIVSATNACGTGSKSYVSNVTCRQGMDDITTAVNVYPNPSSGVVNVEYSASKGLGSIKVLDLSGRTVLELPTNDVDGLNTVRIDMSGFAKGIYMINLQNNTVNYQTRIVVE